MPAPHPGQIKVRRIVTTGAVAAITIVGAIYGAGLRTRQEYKQEKKRIIEATPAQRILMLENRRAELVRQRQPFENKLRNLRLRMVVNKKSKKQKEEEEAGGGNNHDASERK